MHERNRNERNYRNRDDNRHYNDNRDYNRGREANGNRKFNNNRDHNNQNSQGRPPHIEKWLTEKTVVNQYSTEGRQPLRLNAIIERPKFLSGDLGFYRLMTTITVGDYHIRLPIKSLRTLMDWLEHEKETIQDGIQETYELNAEYNGQPQHERSEPGRSHRQGTRRNGPPRRTRGNYRDNSE